MVRLYGEAGVVAGQEVPQHGSGLVDGPGVGQAEFSYQPVLKGLRRTLHPAFGLECVDKLLPKNDKERKPTGFTPYVASRR